MNVLKICITGASGRIAYSLFPGLLDGSIFGDTKIQLHLLDIEGQEARLKGIKMELMDSTFENLHDVICSVDVKEAMNDIDYAILLGGYPRKKGMERKDLIEMNVKNMIPQAIALDQYAKKNVKIIVVANPANTNCLVALSVATTLNPLNFSCLTRLDHERLRSMIASKTKLSVKDINGICIFGNHSSTQVPALGRWDDHPEIDPTWVSDELTPALQQRGAKVIDYLGASSSMSAAAAICKHIKSIVPTQSSSSSSSSSSFDDVFSMGILSDGHTYINDDQKNAANAAKSNPNHMINLHIPKGLIFSFPCRKLSNGKVTVVSDFPIPTSISWMKKIECTVQELEEEAFIAKQILNKMGICVRPDCGLTDVQVQSNL